MKAINALRHFVPLLILLVLSGCSSQPANEQGIYYLSYNGRQDTLTLKSGKYVQVSVINGKTTTQTGVYSSSGGGSGNIYFDKNFMSFYDERGRLEVNSGLKRDQNFRIVCTSDCIIIVSEDSGVQYEKN